MIAKTSFKRTGTGIIPEDWELRKLKDVTVKIFSGGTPDTRREEYWNGNLPWLSSGETNQTFIRDTARKITQAGVDNSSTRVAKKEDVVVAGAGQGYTRGQPSFCLIDTFVNQSVVALRANKEKLIPLFLFYNLLSRYKELRQLSDAHSSRGSLTTKLLAELAIKLPPVAVQESMSKILSDLDFKIELNHRMNKNLDAVGKAIFKHWFIDFEFPNEEGKPYKSSGGEMVYSEEIEKEIPRGWKVGDILDCAEIQSGGTPRTEVAEYWGGGVPWVSARDVTNSEGSFIIDTERTITQLGMDNSNAKLLPKNTTVVTARGVVGSYCILSREMAINQTNYGLKAKVGGGEFFVFFSVSKLVNQMKQRSYGTIFDTITTKTFHDMKIPIPPDSQIKSFEENERSIMNKILVNLQQSRSLVNIRDTLLPKLMSGKIKVPVEVR